MMETVRSQTLFLDSRQRRPGGSTSRWSVVLPTQLVRCQPHERLRVQLLQFSCFYSFQKVHVGNCRFTFIESGTAVEHPIDLPPGNFTFREMCREVMRQYPGVVMRYEGYENGFSFEFTTDHALRFEDDSYEILGFLATEEPEGEAFGSSQIVDLAPVSSLAISCEGMTPLTALNCVALQGLVVPTRTLATIPVQQTPYDWFTYMPASDSQFTLDIVEQQLNELTFGISHADGTAVRDMPDWVLVLRVDVVSHQREDLSRQLLQRVNALYELVRYAFVSRFIS